METPANHPTSSNNPYKVKLKGLSGSDKARAMAMKERWRKVLTDQIFTLLYSRFEWEGIPNYIPPTFIEKELVTRGQILIHEDDNHKLQFSPGYNAGGLNRYDMPIYFNTVARGTNPEVTGRYKLMEDKAVVMYNNALKSSDIITISAYIETLVELKITMEMNQKSHRTPIIMHTTKETKDQVREEALLLEAGVPILFIDTDDDTGRKTPTAQSMNPPMSLHHLHDFYQKVKDEFLVSQGFNKNPYMKKERNIEAEVHMNDQEVGSALKTHLDERRRAIEIAKERGIEGADKLNVKVADNGLLTNPGAGNPREPEPSTDN